MLRAEGLLVYTCVSRKKKVYIERICMNVSKMDVDVHAGRIRVGLDLLPCPATPGK